ncbi:hypothetical protein Scep_027103 [Stephania cephalantha]|uniref:Protein CYCLOPS n=1 Tax=Stephania cephalantha TaxID=152367 RepID=A0AAP0EVB0_9MAGN
MIGDGNGKGLVDDDSLIEIEGSHPSPSLFPSQTGPRRDAEKNSMELEGTGMCSDLYRNTSEEIFLKCLMESSIGMPTPTMDMLGFRNLSQSFRADSEELFNSWLINGEASGHNSTNIVHRTRQASRRISTELSALSNQHGAPIHKKCGNSNDISLAQNVVNQHSNDQSQQMIRNVMEKEIQASNRYLAKAWFHSSQPMTRSRSSELRKRYAAMQNFHTSIGVEALQEPSGLGIDRANQNFMTTNFCDVSMSDAPQQLETFTSPSNSSTSHFSNPPAAVDAVSSVVSMLKGTLERKKLSNQLEKESAEGTLFGFYGAQEVKQNSTSNQGLENNLIVQSLNYQAVSPIQMKSSRSLQTVNGSIDFDMDGFAAPANRVHISAVSQERAQSESSTAAPVPSTGFEVCDGSINSGQTLSVSECSRKQVGNRSLDSGSKNKEFRERILENNLKDDRKKGSLVRMGSVTSGGSGDKGDPTKKRRVERSRKMAEAKERNMTPVVSADMQSILKRCENLEKEVRSLKLNLSFMNRKDSEQTKQIEELQKQNEDLADEKERLLEEIERIISDSGKM